MLSVSVYVVRFEDRKNLAMRFKCPITGKQNQKTCGTSDPEVAAQRAAEWEAELNEGGYTPLVHVDWRVFRQDFADNHLSGLDLDASELFTLALDSFESVCQPDRLSSIAVEHVDFFRNQLRASGVRGAAINARVDRFLQAMDWAHSEGLLKRKLQYTKPTHALGLSSPGVDVHASTGS